MQSICLTANYTGPPVGANVRRLVLS